MDPYNILPELNNLDLDIEILPIVCRDSFQARSTRTLFIGQEPDNNPREIYAKQFLARPNSVFASSAWSKEIDQDPTQILFPVNILLTSRVNPEITPVDLGSKPYTATALFGGWMEIRCQMISRMQELGILDNCLATCRPRRNSLTNETIVFENSENWIDYQSPEIADLEHPIFLRNAYHPNGMQTMVSISDHGRISNLIARNIYNSCYISVITETENLQDPATFYISEKTAKPLIVGHPFLVYGCQHFLKHLRNLGFQTFSPWLDETYDDISDRGTRANAIVDSLQKFSKLSDQEKQQACLKMHSITEHNRSVALDTPGLLKNLIKQL